jgi:hypothetical protein
MFILRLLVIAFIIGYVVWKINNKLLGKNLKLAQVIAAALVETSRKSTERCHAATRLKNN